MAKAGMPIVELQQRLGHANIIMTQRYAIYSPPTASTHYSAALERMGMGRQKGSPAVIPMRHVKNAAP